LKFLCDLESKN